MKLALMSDTHGMLSDPVSLGGAEAIIHAGDVGVDRKPEEWMFKEFYLWAMKVSIPIFMTWGNHDFIGQRASYGVWDALPDNVHILVDEAVEIGGKQFWFSPWSPTFFNWAFMKDENQLADIYAEIPEDTQILVSHTPPFGKGDRVYNDGAVSNVGSTTLLYRIEHLPALEMVVCGHIHGGRGTYKIKRDGLSDVIVENVSLVNEAYKPVFTPVIMEI